MARTVDDAAHARRRQSFLEAAGRVIERKGYEQMTVQDVLDDVGQSKGAFYHYFDSKQALVKGLVGRLSEAIFTHLEQRVSAPDLSALDKLTCLFRESSQLKLERKGLWSALLPMWLSAGNAAVRERASSQVRERMTPVLGQIIAQGVTEGVFTTQHPHQVARMIFVIREDFGHVVMDLLTTPAPGHPDHAQVEQAVAAYNETLERVLGAPTGSLHPLDAADLMAWLDRSDTGAAAPAAHAETATVSGLAAQVRRTRGRDDQ
ncbi:MAG TPA: TetR/AcrR family transcriptional regulator [Acidobacteria bacterium]|nr:TetR/AcrR family transcriptional regulator [Acidobacteriota bacterium]